jgi:hypothetical protein
MQATTKTPDCAPNLAISASLRDGFSLALQAEGRAPKTVTIYCEAVDNHGPPNIALQRRVAPSKVIRR